MDEKLYFDFAATTPVVKSVQEAMLPYYGRFFGNPSSVHSFGRSAANALESSRDIVSKFLNCSYNEVFFTSGATASNNMVLKGLLKKGDHLITSSIEHPSVKNVAEYLEKNGIEVTFVKPEKNGVINSEKIINAVKENTKLISVMYVNNEIGTIQPIKDISHQINELNNDRKQNIYIHSDAVQAAPYIDCNVNELGVDFLSFSGHKIYGPKGVGVLYIKSGVQIQPIFHGGGQEMGMVSGTENVSGIVGIAESINYIAKNKNNNKLKEYRNKILSALSESGLDFVINGDLEKRIHSNINISVKKLQGESMVFKLDMEGIAVSSSSACSSKKIKPSYVLESIGRDNESALSSLRITLGYTTTLDQIDFLCCDLPKILLNMQKSK